MDPRSQAEWELALMEFRKAIGQERPEDVNLLASAAYRTSQGLPPALASYHGQLAAYSFASPGMTYPSHWAMGGPVTPAAARALMGMQMIAWTEPSRWHRLKGTVLRRIRNGRKWLAQKIAGRNFDVY